VAAAAAAAAAAGAAAAEGLPVASALTPADAVQHPAAVDPDLAAGVPPAVPAAAHFAASALWPPGPGAVRLAAPVPAPGAAPAAG